MAQKKSHEVDAWLQRADSRVGLVLCYGPDRGLVSERALQFAKLTGLSLDDPFSVVKIEADTLSRDPGRLLDEAQSIGMFAARRLIWVRGAGADKSLAEDVKLVLSRPPRDAVVLIEAGDLKKGLALRSAVENADAGMALPCYADESRQLDRLIDEELGAAGMSLGLDARQFLRAALGGDRLATRGELQKLTLYARGRDRIDVDDVRLAVSDVSDTSVDDVIDAALSGDIAALGVALPRAMPGAGQTYAVLSAAMRQFQSLQVLRSDVDNGKTATAAVASARPPIFFSRRSLFERCINYWSPANISGVLVLIQSAVLSTRKRPELAVSIASGAILKIAAQAARN